MAAFSNSIYSKEGGDFTAAMNKGVAASNRAFACLPMDGSGTMTGYLNFATGQGPSWNNNSYYIVEDVYALSYYALTAGKRHEFFARGLDNPLYRTVSMQASGVIVDRVIYANGAQPVTVNGYEYLSPTGRVGWYSSGSNTVNYAIIASSRIQCQEVNCPSDARLETSIQPIQGHVAQDILDKIEHVHYVLKKDGAPKLGFLAQNVQKALPKACTENVC